MFKRIVVPLDGSGRAERALPVAARLARASGGTLFLVRVVSTAPASLPSAAGRPLLVQTVGETDRVQAESYLEGWAGSDLLSGLSVQTSVPIGLVSPSILSVATDKHADIIVMCSHGTTGVKRWWLLGSDAAKVARFAQMPVLVLREGGPVPEERQPGESPLRVLVPLDGSNYAQEALLPAAYLAAALAAPGQGALHLTHIVQSASYAKVPVAAFQNTRNVQADQNMAREYLRATINQFQGKSGDSAIANLHLALTSSVAVNEDIAQGIVEIAENGGTDGGTEVFGGCDVIAMATQGSSGIQHWVGSVTERVLHISRLPLLIVQPH